VLRNRHGVTGAENTLFHVARLKKSFPKGGE
jgi:hypothetical protein